MEANKIITYRKYFLFISKTLAILFCIYFIICAQNYEVSWNFLSTWMPEFTSKINRLLANIGTYILILPLTLCIVSLFISNVTLNIIVACFGVGGSLFTLISSVWNGTFGEIYNMRLVVITQIMSLEKKREIFLSEYNKIANEKYTLVTNKLSYLMSNITETSLNNYDTILNHLKEVPAIKAYANNVIIGLMVQYEKDNSQNTVMLWISNHSKALLIVGGLLLASIVIYKCFGSDIELAEITKEGASISQQGQDLMTNHLSDTKTSLDSISKALQLLTNQYEKLVDRANAMTNRIEALERSIEYSIMPRLFTLLQHASRNPNELL